MAPTIINAASQPQCFPIHGTVSGASTAPILAPELKIPVDNDLSFLGKYSAVAFIAAGKFPASPNASIALENIKPKTEMENPAMPNQPNTAATPSPIGTAAACTIAANDQMTMAHA